MLPNNVMAVHPKLVKIGYYFPAVSPHPGAHEKAAYEININGRSLHAAQVSRLEQVTWDGKLRYIQTVFLEQAPTFIMGEEGFIRGNQAAGTTELAVEGTSLLLALSLLDLSVKPLPKLHVMGAQERMSYRVTKVEIDPPAGTKADGARGKLTIDRALTSEVLDGNTIFVAIDSGLLNNGSVVEKRYHGCDKPAAAHVYAVQTLEVVNGDREAYLPVRQLVCAQRPQQCHSALPQHQLARAPGARGALPAERLGPVVGVPGGLGGDVQRILHSGRGVCGGQGARRDGGGRVSGGNAAHKGLDV